MGTAMGPIGIGATLASGFISAAGDLFQGQAQSNMYKYQAGVARQRAAVQEQNARWAYQTGETNAYIQGIRTGQTVGAERAGQGAGNLDVSSGSPSAIRASETEMGQRSQGIIRTNAARQQYGFEVAAAGERATASALDVGASTAITSGEIGAVSSILSAAAGTASKWQQASMAFGPGAPNQNAVGGSPYTLGGATGDQPLQIAPSYYT